MKNILNKIEIHPLLIICTLIFILIGRFKFIVCFMFLILVHELGHIVCALALKWSISKIIFLPLGGLIIFEDKIDKPLIEELLISISGIISQTVFYLMLKDKVKYEYFIFTNYFILCFNLLPIYPLDGSKILNVLINMLSTFKISININIIISSIFIIVLTIFSLKANLLILLMCVFLIKEVIKLYKQKKYIFNKLLLEKYLYGSIYKKKRIIAGINKIKRNYTHIFLINNKIYKEEEYLKKYFNNV